MLEIAGCLDAQAIDFTLLKGAAHSPDFTPDPLLRAHSDVDIWCAAEDIRAAWRALTEIGYHPLTESKGRHLAPLARSTQWKWRGDYYAADLPLPVDLHYSLWDAKLECLAGPSEWEFWRRRRAILVRGCSVKTLSIADTLAFAALHSLMHMLHGDLRLQRAWEIAYFLHHHASDDDFWNHWQEVHPPESQTLEVIMFALAAAWFQCELPALLVREIEALPPDVRLWMAHYTWSPVESLFAPNKNEIWLHLALLGHARDRRNVFLRRMLPMNLQPSDDLHAATEAEDSSGAIRRRPMRFRLSRAVRHLRTFLPTLTQGARWWWIRQRLDRNFSIFLLSSGLFDLGEFIFFLLYNLYLLDLGFNERLVGQAAGAMTTGSFLGVLPAAALVRRWGLRPALVLAIAGASVSSILRVLASSVTPLLLFAFLNGVFLSVWAVCLPPAVAASTSERNRATGFSLITSIGISIGVVAGLIGGHLPGLLARLSARTGQLEVKRAALLLGSAVVLLAIPPALRLRFPVMPVSPSGKKSYPRGKFIVGFMTALFVWSFATGAFNPFFNVYFAQHLRLPVERIGAISSVGQLAQVFAILMAPMFLKRVGNTKGISYAQMATALMLGLLAFVSTPATAACTYIAYMAFQYMTEPCLFTLLMNRVDPAERGGASALNFLAASSAGALSAVASGVAVSKFGYSWVLSIASVLACVAAILMFTCAREKSDAASIC